MLDNHVSWQLSSLTLVIYGNWQKGMVWHHESHLEKEIPGVSDTGQEGGSLIAVRGKGHVTGNSPEGGLKDR